ARQQKAEHDRALAQARNEEARLREQRLQARQMILDHAVKASGDRAYRFEADGAIRSLLVDDAQATQIASGALVIARLDSSYVLLQRNSVAKIRERDPDAIVVDYGTGGAAPDDADGY